jgi:glycosyltransferase involved in cell wall biosynthesis
MKERHIRILGTRGVPAAHGGFETFAEHLAPYLVEHGWQVTVYCQEDGTGPVFEDDWRGVRRVRMPVATQGAAGTIVFDWKSTVHAAGEKGLLLTLGYNTAVFCALYRLKGLRNVINMDGVEWRRQKWGGVAKLWFWLNDWAGCWLGNHLVADHPEIKRHLTTRVRPDKITMIPYGSDRVDTASPEAIAPYGLTPGSYAILIARAEPENSILEVVQAWSKEKRHCKLVVLGKYDPNHAYQRAVKNAASDEVLFPGAIYDKTVVQALRFHARFYVHGHQVGGTNPSLVEALGAGNAVLGHENPYNRWVAGDAGVYFKDAQTCAQAITRLLNDPELLGQLQAASRARHAEAFTWEKILGDYETLLLEWVG